MGWSPQGNEGKGSHTYPFPSSGWLLSFTWLWQSFLEESSVHITAFQQNSKCASIRTSIQFWLKSIFLQRDNSNILQWSFSFLTIMSYMRISYIALAVPFPMMQFGPLSYGNKSNIKPCVVLCLLR